jgi:polygalacturonase
MTLFVFDGSDWGFEARSSWNGPAFFNVKDFGARGDDQSGASAADELVAIQQALDAARDTGNGGVLYFPRGVY